MIDFGKWAFANRKLVYFVVAVLLVGGILSAYDMSKLEDPEIKVKLAMVIATRPGASAHEMELEEMCIRDRREAVEVVRMFDQFRQA